jgi:hypothetical protein
MKLAAPRILQFRLPNEPVPVQIDMLDRDPWKRFAQADLQVLPTQGGQ